MIKASELWCVAGSPGISVRVTVEIIALAREADFSSYDASYLDLALREEAMLATQDQGLRKAAAKVGVAVFTKRGEE